MRFRAAAPTTRVARARSTIAWWSGPTCSTPARPARPAGCTRRTAPRRLTEVDHDGIGTGPRPGQELRRLAALAQPGARAQAPGVAEGGRRRELLDRARQDAGAGRR